MATAALLLVDEFSTIDKLFCDHATGDCCDIAAEFRWLSEYVKESVLTGRFAVRLRMQQEGSTDTASSKCQSPPFATANLPIVPQLEPLETERNQKDQEANEATSGASSESTDWRNAKSFGASAKDAILAFDIRIEHLEFEMDASVACLLLVNMKHAISSRAGHNTLSTSISVQIDGCSFALVDSGACGSFKVSNKKTEQVRRIMRN